MLIYKILLPAEWAEFESAGRFDGSPFDHESGFIHLSSREQVGGTALRVFSDQPDLVVAAIDTERLRDPLRWEPASNGDVFPHVYGSLPMEAVAAVHRVAGASTVEDAVAAD